jgi:hypothetical protein
MFLFCGGVLTGLFVGAGFGMIITALCVTAKRGDKQGGIQA